MQLLAFARSRWAGLPPAARETRRTVVPAATRKSLLRRVGAVLATALMLGTFLVAGGGTAQAADPDTHRLATWNMQVGQDRWGGVRPLVRDNSVVALQEVPGNPPGGAVPLGTTNGIEGWQWDLGRDGIRYVYIVRTPSRNVGIVTSFYPDRVMVIGGPYRPAVAVTRSDDNVLFASAHGSSGNGGVDVPTLLGNIATEAANAGMPNWAVMGDFNRDPSTLTPANLPANARIYNSGQATHQGGNELDYMVSNVDTETWQATVGVNRGSDHWPVHFGSLQGALGPQQLSVTADISGRNLDVNYASTDDGAQVIQHSDNDGSNQRWELWRTAHTAADGDPLYRIINRATPKCLDVDNGQHSGPGDYLNIWTCHAQDGPDEGGGPSVDTQNWTLEHPVAHMPNLTLLRNNATGLYANIGEEVTGDGGWVIQWLGPEGGAAPAANEIFYLHPTVRNE
ncbi:RICIN domain-containing protein [Streptomyces sp. NPDC050844]|uniref:RICIN domain-containing protein n=1 Tax=Streptomyces sp. NPDC050844 TaxID=3155790 RepID=UPI0033EB1602